MADHTHLLFLVVHLLHFCRGISKAVEFGEDYNPPELVRADVSTCMPTWPNNNMEFYVSPFNFLSNGVTIGYTFAEPRQGRFVCIRIDGISQGCYPAESNVLELSLDSGEGRHLFEAWCGNKTDFAGYYTASLSFSIVHFPFGEATATRSMYLEVLKKSIMGVGEWRYLSSKSDLHPYNRMLGRDFPATGITMLGQYRLDNIRFALETVLHENIMGDFLEAGVWRGGAGVFAKGVMKSLDVNDRKIWMCDSYQGLPVASTDKDSNYWASHSDIFAVSVPEVRSGFEEHGLLDDNIVFLKGWFFDSLPLLPAHLKLSVVRLDGDMYESYMDCLFNLYSKISVGGFVVVDDYVLPQVIDVISDFRRLHGILDPLVAIDIDSVYWRKSEEVALRVEWYQQFNRGRWGGGTDTTTARMG